jgi:hypothetical protein
MYSLSLYRVKFKKTILIDLFKFRRGMFFQQEGTIPHNAEININFVLTQFATNWMHTREPIKWPTSSLDLSPLDFFFGRYIQNKR